MNKDPVVLSYDESLLRKSDVDLLYGPHWLNDNIISFYFEYLKNYFKNAPFLLFVSPEVTQCIKIVAPAQLEVFLDPLDSRNKRFIFFALNDNERPQFAGGSHWSLLLYSRPEATVYHFDSSQGSNNKQAECLAHKLFDYFEVDGVFKEETSQQQTNGYDCGVYLLYNAEILAQYLSEHRTMKNYHYFDDSLYNAASNMRQKIIDIIEKLRG